MTSKSSAARPSSRDDDTGLDDELGLGVGRPCGGNEAELGPGLDQHLAAERASPRGRRSGGCAASSATRRRARARRRPPPPRGRTPPSGRRRARRAAPPRPRARRRRSPRTERGVDLEQLVVRHVRELRRPLEAVGELRAARCPGDLGLERERLGGRPCIRRSELAGARGGERDATRDRGPTASGRGLPAAFRAGSRWPGRVHGHRVG